MTKDQIKEILLQEERHAAYQKVAAVYQSWSPAVAEVLVGLIEDAAADPNDEDLWTILPDVIYILYQARHKPKEAREAVEKVKNLSSPYRNDSGMKDSLDRFKSIRY